MLAKAAFLGIVFVVAAPPRVDWSQAPPPSRVALAAFSQAPEPVAPPAPVLWTRVDSHGATWTHPDRHVLDAHVDAVERGYAGHLPATHSAAPVFGSCAGGTCSVGYAAPLRSTIRIFGRR